MPAVKPIFDSTPLLVLIGSVDKELFFPQMAIFKLFQFFNIIEEKDGADIS